MSAVSSQRAMRRRACEGKVKHGSYFAAKIAARRTGELHGETEVAGSPGFNHLVPYKCKFCPGWHVGHQPVKNLRAMQARREGG